MRIISLIKSDLVKILAPIIISLLALIIAIRSECHNEIQDKKYAKLVYLQDATAEKPILKLVNPLDKLKWDFIVNSIGVPENDSIPVIKFEVTIKGNLEIINEGMSAAHLRAIGVADSFTASPIIRKIFLDENKRIGLPVEDFREKDFFYHRTILPSQIDSIDFEKKIRYFSQDSMMVVHIILLYEDDMNALFDTYYWVRIHSREIELKPKGGIYKGMIFQSFKFAVNDLVTPIQDNTDYYVYSLDERNSIFAWWKEVERELKEKLE